MNVNHFFTFLQLQPSISSKGGIPSFLNSSPMCPAPSIVIVSVRELGFGGLFGGIWSDLAISASIENACVELCDSSDVVPEVYCCMY